MEFYLNIGGIISIIVFYILILVVGIWAGKKSKNASEEEVMLAGRNIGLFVGIFTMTATWVGGGYINGTAESVYNDGLIWCQAPFGYALSLIFGGTIFANKMRRMGYITMLDPLQDCLGERMGGLLYIPALCGEVFWSAAILSALGATLSVIINIPNTYSVVVSALIAILYTLFGGLYAVAYTDVIQLFCIFIGLWVAIPFAMTHPAVKSMDPDVVDWFGSVDVKDLGTYMDYGLLLIFGGIPWQVYFQRVLACKTPRLAQIMSFAAAAGAIIMVIPSALFGIVGKATNWNETTYTGPLPISGEDTKMILPLVLQYLTPAFVAFIGLGAVSAAVMSSADSSVLGASSMFTRNVYKLVFRPAASEKELSMVMKIAILGVGVLATIMALTIKTIYGLWYLCADFVYVILFPQLLLVVHFQDYVNTYGSLVAYFLGIFIRMLGGEDILGLPAAVHFPWYNYETGSQRFPFRTMAMLVSMITFLVVSGVTNWLFMSGRLPPKYDYFRCIVNIPDDVQKVESPTDGELAVMNSVLGKQYNATEERNGRVNPALTLDSESEPETDIPPPPYPGVGMKSPSKVPLTKETSKF